MWKGEETMLRNSNQRLGFQTPKFVVENPVIRGKPSSGFPYCLLRFSFFCQKVRSFQKTLFIIIYKPEGKKWLVPEHFLGSCGRGSTTDDFWVISKWVKKFGKLSFLGVPEQYAARRKMLNDDSGFTCSICGRHKEILSKVFPQANYDSFQYDGERYTPRLCCGCIDCSINAVRQHIQPERMHQEQLLCSLLGACWKK